VALSKERLLIQQLNLKQQLRTLEILVGRYPSATITVTDSLPTMSASIPAGLPSELLDRRPDINASHARWQATVFDTEVAAKRRLPSFSLTAQSGTSSSELKDLLDWDHLLWNLLGNLSQPLFQQDQLKAEERIKLINQKQAATDYAEIVFNAFHEVENHLTAEQFQQQRVHVLLQAAEESGKASDLALSRYQSGLIDILTLLDTQQRAYDQQSAHLNAIAKHIDNRIQLYLALGGSF
jgi:outer membrane protein TolC